MRRRTVKHFVLEPEVAGGFGGNTKVIHAHASSFTVERLHYQFDGWLGDEVVESTPCFIVSKALADDLERARLTGFLFDEVEVTVSKQFADQQGRLILPEFLWLKVDGAVGIDDFGLNTDLMLVVSERALETLTSSIAHASVRAAALDDLRASAKYEEEM